MPLNDVINPPSADAGIPQANTESIARGLMGNDIVDNFGHAMGVRPTTAADVMRDTYLGATVGPANVAKLHQDALKQWRQENIDSQRLGFAQATADAQKREEWIHAVNYARDPANLSPKYRVAYVTEVAKTLGLTPSPTIMKQLVDSENGVKDKVVEQVANAWRGMPFGDMAANLADITAAQKLIGAASTEASKVVDLANANVNLAKGKLDLAKKQAEPTPLTPRQKEAQKEYERLRMTRVKKVTLDTNPDSPTFNQNITTHEPMPQQDILNRMATGYPDLYQEQGLGSSSAADQPILGMAPPAAATPAAPILDMPAKPPSAPAPAAPTAQDLGVPNNRAVIKLQGGSATPLQ
jgi:hypothetical protein